MEYIANAVLNQLTVSCIECGINSDIIDKKQQSFICFPESPTSVTYRARLEGTSETDSGSLISLIEEWVSSGASIIVTGVLMTVDSECSVAITSLGEGECQSPTIEPTTEPISNGTMTTSGSTTDNTAAVVGGVVAVILIITFAAVAVIITLILKKRCGKVSINKRKE